MNEVETPDAVAGPQGAVFLRSGYRTIGGLLASAALLLSCGTNRTPYQPADYVALGSSFAAGPGVGSRDPGSPLLCARSAQNYPHQVAAALGLRLRDMTCSGATIANALTDRQARQPPQIQGIDGRVRLVTVTIGGNDVSYLGNLIGESCATARARLPFLWRPLLCRITPSGTVARQFSALPSRLATMIDRIRDRAPRARIVLVDYTTILPAKGSCPDIAPLTSRQVERGNFYAARLSMITRQIAQAKGALFVAASQVTAGHDVCSRDPWVNGLVFQKMPLTWGPAAYHPNDKAVRAIAQAIATAVSVHGP